MNEQALREQLRRWREAGLLSSLDLHFGLFVAEGSGSPALGLLAAVTSRQRGLGHVCLDPALPPGELPGLELEALWLEALDAGPPWVCAGGTDPPGPLVHDHGRLYLGRMHAAECALAERLGRWSTAPAGIPPERGLVDRLFPKRDPGAAGQRLAAVLAAIRPFTVITGGPGTGKTTTVVRVLALRLAARPELAIRLLAPTGKAAARLSESLRTSKAALGVDEALAGRIPDRVTTVHRFLGLGYGRPRFHRHHPAPVDLVVLDEASMIDLPTMHRLMEALPAHAALILLGDPDQLASVEAGSVLADLVAPARPEAFTAPTRTALERAGVPLPPPVVDAGPLDDTLARLAFSHRFSADRGIGLLARSVRDGTADWAALQRIAAEHEEIECVSWAGTQVPRTALEDLLAALDPDRHETVEAALDALGEARVLCALRGGAAGVDAFNAQIARRLGRDTRGTLHGLPVLVTRNAHTLGVYNGDMGVLWEEPDTQGRRRLRACFPMPPAGVRRIPLAELPEHETAFALTVHKSQGSEYDRILLVLPPEPHPLVTRELIYTALTRARRFVRILATPACWEAGVRQRTRRASGLAVRLQGAAVSGGA